MAIHNRIIKKIITLFSLVFVLGTADLYAEFLYSNYYGWAMDLPEGFKLVEQSPSGNSYYLEHSFVKAHLAVKAYPQSQYERNDIALENVLNDLNADGEIDGFLWNGRHASVATYEFQIPGNDIPQKGWGASVTIPERQSHLIILSYTDKDKANDLDQFLISVIDSLMIDDSDFRSPGLITSYAFPDTGNTDLELNIKGKRIFTTIPSNAKEASRFVIDREYSVLTLYANQKDWKEAWQRYYRFIFRDAYSRLNDPATAIYSTLYPDALYSDKKNPELELCRILLEWVQNFDYNREVNNADFNDMSSILQGGGSDCDSRSLLLCILMEHYGIKSELFVSMAYSHAVFGIVSDAPGAHIMTGGNNFLLGETTAHVDLGLIAREHSDTDKWIPVDLP